MYLVSFHNLFTVYLFLSSTHLISLFLFGKEDDDEGDCGPAMHDPNMRSSEVEPGKLTSGP